ncbi:MAG: CRISPR-associated protein Cas5 [Candidatus Heimdallarchaeaceae archaeon]|jgi:CRISPR-associated protein Cas5d
MSIYNISLEISGNTAMWTRPDTGDCPVSYPAPTYSAAKGIFESILWIKTVEVIPTKVEICAPVIFYRYCTNYCGPLKKSGVDNYQLLATVLVDVCYRLYAEVKQLSEQQMGRIPDSKRETLNKKTTSPGHAYQDIFNRRLNRGQCFYIPFLGWKEFAPNYLGPLRNNTRIEEDISLTIPSMLREVFSKGYKSGFSPSYDLDVSIKNGVMEYPRRERQC